MSGSKEDTLEAVHYVEPGKIRISNIQRNTDEISSLVSLFIKSQIIIWISSQIIYTVEFAY